MPRISDKTIRICARCGDEYHPKSSRQKCCNKPIKVPCAICSKLMDQICTFADQSKTCSKACADALIKRTREASAAKIVKTCKYCGKEFSPKFVREEYCPGPHFATCEICEKQFEIFDVKRMDARRTCSDECQKQLQIKSTDYVAAHKTHVASLLAKYGVDNSAKIPGSSDKAKATSLERYGKEYYTQTEKYRDRVKATDLAKYGCEHHLQSPEVRDKRVNTVQAKYGVDNVFQADTIKSKIQSVMQARYRVSNISSLRIGNPKGWEEFTDDPYEYIRSNYAELPTIHVLSADLGVSESWIYANIKNLDYSKLIKKSASILEEDIISFIRSCRPELIIRTHDRTVIYPYELDIYIPELQLAIECNPTITHNSSFEDPWGGEPKSSQYHKMKSTMCRTKGILLFHVFGYEWTTKREIILSMIRNLIHSNTTRIFARKCEIRELSDIQSRQFLESNHRQGSTVSKIRIGLFYADELVAVMTFGKPRVTMSSSIQNWELLRFCNRIDTTVIGGASKLFTYFKNTYKPTSIISFSDIAHTSGLLYNKLGFAPIAESRPGYHWVDVTTDIAYNRIATQKHNLRKFLQDDNLDLTQTEKQIMEAHGYAQVFDAGTITWQWIASELNG